MTNEYIALAAKIADRVAQGTLGLIGTPFTPVQVTNIVASQQGQLDVGILAIALNNEFHKWLLDANENGHLCLENLEVAMLAPNWLDAYLYLWRIQLPHRAAAEKRCDEFAERLLSGERL